MLGVMFLEDIMGKWFVGKLSLEIIWNVVLKLCFYKKKFFFRLLKIYWFFSDFNLEEILNKEKKI